MWGDPVLQVLLDRIQPLTPLGWGRVNESLRTHQPPDQDAQAVDTGQEAGRLAGEQRKQPGKHFSGNGARFCEALRRAGSALSAEAAGRRLCTANSK